MILKGYLVAIGRDLSIKDVLFLIIDGTGVSKVGATPSSEDLTETTLGEPVSEASFLEPFWEFLFEA